MINNLLAQVFLILSFFTKKTPFDTISKGVYKNTETESIQQIYFCAFSKMFSYLDAREFLNVSVFISTAPFQRKTSACIYCNKTLRRQLICVDSLRLYSVGYEITSIEFLGSDETDERMFPLSCSVPRKATSIQNMISRLVRAILDLSNLHR